MIIFLQLPEPNVAINSIDIDADASYLAAVNTQGKAAVLDTIGVFTSYEVFMMTALILMCF